MQDVQIIPSAPVEPAARTAWVQPELHLLDATAAESAPGLNSDGLFTS